MCPSSYPRVNGSRPRGPWTPEHQDKRAMVMRSGNDARCNFVGGATLLHHRGDGGDILGG